MAFDSIARFAPVHILICPLEHLTEFMQVNFNALFLIAENLTKELEIYHTGFRIVCNQGNDAHQTIEHLHIHLLGGKDLGLNFANKEATHASI